MSACAFYERKLLNGGIQSVSVQFHIGGDPTACKDGGNNFCPHELSEVQLDGHELEYRRAQSRRNQSQQKVVTYFGDEARRIVFNW